ncbi:MAG TPA: hypothetical protein VIM41_07505 [Gammaproteobacteria bacterium]
MMVLLNFRIESREPRFCVCRVTTRTRFYQPGKREYHKLGIMSFGGHRKAIGSLMKFRIKLFELRRQRLLQFLCQGRREFLLQDKALV